MSGDSGAVLAWCAFALLMGGSVKGMLGIGMPLVSVSLLTLFVPVPQAVALLPVPMLVANVWQSLRGRHVLSTFAQSRYRVLMIAMGVGTVVGGRLLAGLDAHVLTAVLGVMVAVYALWELLALGGPVRRRNLGWPFAVLAGGVGGILGGMSTLFGPPIVMYLVATGLEKDEFVGTVATVYLVGCLALVGTYAGFGVMGPRQFAWSALAVVPVFTGVLLGQCVRGRVSQQAFRKVLLGLLVVIGIRLLWRALLVHAAAA